MRPHIFSRASSLGRGVSVSGMGFGLGLWVEGGRWEVGVGGNNDEEVGDWETQELYCRLKLTGVRREMGT